MSRPAVSVILPCYNGARFLPEAVTSVRRQQYEPLEILIVDDGSTDATPQVAPQLGADVRYFRKDNGGPASARNVGLREARGEVIAFLDADDQWPDGKLALQLARLEADPALDVVTGRVQYIELPGAEHLDLRFEGPDQTLTHVHLGAGLYRRRAFDTVGPFDEAFRISDDTDWFLRARELGLKIIVLADVTLLYRLHDSNLTRRARTRDFMMTELVHKSLERRRRIHGAVRELAPWSSLDEKRRSDA
jgi:glycosyltransferase involved in cell wall biosynthesis